jgi:hypothetical protein
VIFCQCVSPSIDAFCQVWADTRHKNLTNLLVKKSWVASAPIDIRVLSALKIKQLQVVTRGSEEIVEPLLNAFRDHDSEIANRASEYVISLTNSEAIDYICHLAIKQGHQLAHQIAIKAQYAPREPNQRALFYFLTEQWDQYESLDYEHSLLQKVYELGGEKLRKQIADKARQAGRIEWVGVVAGGRKGQRLGAMSDTEWETTLNVLDSGKQWEEMWRLAQKAPAIWSKQLLQKLKQVAWLPQAEQERVGFERLKQLADNCLNKMPSMRSMGKLTHCQAILTGHDRILKIIFSPDGKILASCSSDNTSNKIKLWQIPSGQPLITICAYRSLDELINLGKLLTNFDELNKLPQIPNGQPLDILTGYTGAVYQISFSPDGKILACSSDKTIKLWSSAIRIPVKQLCQQNRGLIKKTSQDREITKEERQWLKFIQALMDWYQRFDVEVENTPQLISTGEFDVEIEW